MITSSILSIDMNLINTFTTGQSGAGSNGNKEVFHLQD